MRRSRKRAIKRKRNAIAHCRTKIHEEHFEAPKIFSFIENSDLTISYFDRLISYISKKENFGSQIFIDTSKVEVLTIDALMYLLALVNNRNRNLKTKYFFKGNFPRNPKIRKLMENSGFDRFVQYSGDKPIIKSVDNIQIVSGEKVDTNLAKKICDFILKKGNVTRVACQFIYNMMIELMANVYAHAYSEANSILYSRWYCFAEYDAVENTVNFTFMDTGDGIPSTVRKHGLEHIDFLDLKGDGPYVLSALKGELRSKTKKAYRGKGLPKVFSYCKNNQIQNMRIITNKADVTIMDSEPDSKELPTSLKGTLFYWKINLFDLEMVAREKAALTA